MENTNKQFAMLLCKCYKINKDTEMMIFSNNPIKNLCDSTNWLLNSNTRVPILL